MESIPKLSVIIPTYNRKDSLLRALNSLGRQTYPSDRYEIIIVDDGSTDGTRDLARDVFPFPVRYYRQENAGATQARNTGARCSSAEVLVFIDDDITATPDLLENLVQEISTRRRVIVIGTLILASHNATNPFSVMFSNGAIFRWNVDNLEPIVTQGPESEPGGHFIHFTQCMTGILAIRRQDFCALGGFQDPTGGWPNWDDIDFGYRAHLGGVRLRRSHRAIAYHNDYSLESLEASCKRFENASRSAARFFECHPELIQYFPAYCDKGPPSILTDSFGILTRKVLRSLISSVPSVAAMQQLRRILEKYVPNSLLLALIYRWIIGASMQRGYHQGLRELTAGRI